MVSKYKKSLKTFLTSFSILNVIKIFRFILGHYFSMTTSKIISFFLKLYCISVALAAAALNIQAFTSPFTVGTIEYVLCIFMSLYTGEEYFYKYCTTMKTIDAVMGHKKGTIIENNIRLTVLVSFFIMAGFTAFYYTGYYAIDWSLVFHTIMMTSIRTNYLLVIIAFFLMYNRIKRVKKIFEKNFISVNIVGKNGVVGEIKQIRKATMSYRNLLDNLRSIDNELQCLIFIILLFSLPILIYYVYATIKAYLRCHKSATTVTALFMGAQMIDLLVQVGLPAVVAELTIDEVYNIQTILHKQLLRCSDSSLRFELETALDYINRRCFSYTIARAVPLDSSIPAGMVTLCITYVIVIIQFTRFKDI